MTSGPATATPSDSADMCPSLGSLLPFLSSDLVTAGLDPQSPLGRRLLAINGVYFDGCAVTVTP